MNFETHSWDQKTKIFPPCYPLNPIVTTPRIPRDFDYFIELLNNSNESDVKKGLYIHVPFCNSICTFCCFYRVLKDQSLVKKYISALRSEIKLYAETNYIKSSIFDAVYFGGGTPTCISSEDLMEILSYCKENFKISNNAEITIEGNPSDFDDKKFGSFLENGVNRLSFGVQTFDTLMRQKVLGRRLAGEEVARVIRDVHELGFNNVDIDLMYDLPGQTIEDWRKDLQTAIDLEVESLSFYRLRIYQTSKLAEMIKSGEVPPQSNKHAEMYLLAIEMLRDAGYKQQSVDHFVLPSKEHLYSRIRLMPGETLALGPSPNGILGHYVYANVRSLEEYLAMISKGKFPIADGMRTSAADELRRAMMGQLKMLRVDVNEFQQRFKNPLDVFSTVLSELERRNLVLVNDREIKLTERGMLLIDDVLMAIASS